MSYLYIKDRTWTLIGAAVDEALPEKAPSASEVQRAVREGRYPGRKKEPGKSRAIIDGLGCCYYPMIESFDSPPASGHSERWVEGTNIAFGFIESPPLHVEEAQRAGHEMFFYVIRGSLDARIGREKQRVRAGDVLVVPKGRNYRLAVTKGGAARYAAVRSTQRLEAAISKHGAADNWRG